MNFQLSILKIVVHVEVEVEVEFSNDVSWYMCINYTREKSKVISQIKSVL